jgi:chromosome segregation ATPase
MRKNPIALAVLLLTARTGYADDQQSTTQDRPKTPEQARDAPRRSEIDRLRGELDKLRNELRAEKQRSDEIDKAIARWTQSEAQLQAQLKSQADEIDRAKRALEQTQQRKNDLEAEARRLGGELRRSQLIQDRFAGEVGRVHELLQAAAARPVQAPEGAKSGATVEQKLDAILRRLDQLEKRLDRLEKGSPKAPPPRGPGLDD